MATSTSVSPHLSLRRSQLGLGIDAEKEADPDRVLDKATLTTPAALHQAVRWSCRKVQQGGLGKGNHLKAAHLLDGLLDRLEGQDPISGPGWG